MNSPETDLTRFNEEEAQAFHQAKRVGLWAGVALAQSIANQELNVENRKLKYKATHDKLTGLLNLDGLTEFLEQDPVLDGVVLFVDGTNIKKINDQLGHDAGNDAIIGIANILKGTVREGDIVARIGGDEFVVVAAPFYRKDKLFPPEEQLSIMINRVTTGTAEFREANPNLQALGFDIAVGGTIAQPGFSLDEHQRVAEDKMYQHKAIQHEQNGAYR